MGLKRKMFISLSQQFFVRKVSPKDFFKKKERAKRILDIKEVLFVYENVICTTNYYLPHNIRSDASSTSAFSVRKIMLRHMTNCLFAPPIKNNVGREKFLKKEIIWLIMK
ncbi:unnamed protein product [Rhizophagus irregularis]|uniref:Uncharacterized protein n=1 Tax=Rhizophagus irregularis TaxID=588596 RepID=A0A916EJ56_9GLOM|nr:unnamed protein product [Rhizophagus irregularis]CAB5387165.1 unnamed protein product [Rhizophagus irregularis]